ncbi:hypothetical protein I79_007096 [Cricetulus griseus]|uniref:Uncharacterized protein n=1 Tax=Cricetulus griseus TaxID=10029 RepID=G3H9M0_CRIGR|nr:hypothetical protein I79_007096 [Cricetulus griseus]
MGLGLGLDTKGKESKLNTNIYFSLFSESGLSVTSGLTLLPAQLGPLTLPHLSSHGELDPQMVNQTV